MDNSLKFDMILIDLTNLTKWEKNSIVREENSNGKNP